MKRMFLPVLLICCLLPAHLHAFDGQPPYPYAPPPPPSPVYLVYPRPPLGLVSIGGGVFVPRGDIDNFDTGGNATLSGILNIGKYLGAGLDINFNETKYSSNIYYNNGYPTPYNGYIYYGDNRIDTTSLEFLLYIQPNEARVQPYLAGGAGIYFNNMTIGPYSYYDNDGVGYGWVGKVGVRAFLQDYLVIGAYGKYYSNNQDVKVAFYDASRALYTLEKTLNLGGYTICVEFGTRF